jgi:putative transposase
VNNNIKVDFEKELLHLPKIKDGIKIEIHRKFEGKIKSITITKAKSGNYYASILVELKILRIKQNNLKTRFVALI